MSGQVARKRMDVERLVQWALVDQGQGFVGREVVRQDWSDYGGEVDVSPVRGLPSVSLLSHDDAVVVRQAVDALPREMAALVLHFGRASSRPDWAPEGYGEPEQMRNKRGQLMWDYAVPGNRRSARTPKLDHWAHSRRKATVDYFRKTWELWRRGLELLVPAANNRMQEHLATGPEAPRAPWDLPQAARIAPEHLPPEARARLARYADRGGLEADDVRDGLLTVDEIRQAGSAPVQDMANVMSSQTASGVDAQFKRDRVAAVGREAIQRRLSEAKSGPEEAD